MEETQAMRAAAEAHRRYGPAAVPHYVISMATNVSDVLEVGVLLKEAGLLHPREGRLDLDIIPLFETIDDLRNSAEVRESHTVDVGVPDDPVWCEADEGQIRQIIWNLATNGLRAMPDGGRLRLGASTDNTGVVITVRDEGIGIASEAFD